MQRPFDRLADTARPLTHRKPRRTAVPLLERLEDRCTPARLLWAGPDWGFWHDAANWVDPVTEQPAGIAPGPKDDVLIDGYRFATSSVTGDVTEIHGLEVVNFVHAVTVDDGDEDADLAAELTINGPCLLSLGQGIVVHGIFRGAEPDSPADILITGEGAGLTWRWGDIDNIHFVLDFGTDSLIRVAGDSGGGHSSLTNSVIENFGNVEVNHTILGLNNNTVVNNGNWLLNDLVYAWYGGNSTFVNNALGLGGTGGHFQVIGTINYWYFDITNLGATEIGGTYPITNYVGILIAGDYDQGLPLPIDIVPAPYTRIPFGGGLYVGQLMQETLSVYQGSLILDGTIHGTVETAPGTTLVAGTLDFTTGAFGSGTATIQNGSISIGGTLWITVDHLQNGMTVASRLSAVGETLTLGPLSTLHVHNTGETPDDGWEQDIITAETVIGEFGALIFSGVTFWFDQNGVPHTWFVEKRSVPFLTRYILKVVSPENPPVIVLPPVFGPGPLPPLIPPLAPDELN